MICTVIKAVNREGDTVYAYSPLFLWENEYLKQTTMWEAMKQNIALSFPNYTSRDIWDVPVLSESRAPHLQHLIYNDVASHRHFFNICFNPSHNEIPIKEKQNLPAVVIDVGSRPRAPQPASFIPQSGIVDPGFARRDAQTRRKNYITSNHLRMEPPSLPLFRHQKAMKVDPLADLWTACECMKTAKYKARMSVNNLIIFDEPLLFSYKLLSSRRVDVLSRTLSGITSFLNPTVSRDEMSKVCVASGGLACGAEASTKPRGRVNRVDGATPGGANRAPQLFLPRNKALLPALGQKKVGMFKQKPPTLEEKEIADAMNRIERRVSEMRGDEAANPRNHPSVLRF
jgi:hypothetical protein